MENGDTMTSGAYTIPSETNLKQYYIIGEVKEGEIPFGAGKVIAPIDENLESKNDRFYVLALEDINVGTTYKWASKTWSGATERTFGKGRNNSKTMLENEGKQSETVWEAISEKTGKEYDDGPEWFILSNAEWAAFGRAFDITGSNYDDFELSNMYWTSSDAGSYACYAGLWTGTMNDIAVYKKCHVRLATTF